MRADLGVPPELRRADRRERLDQRSLGFDRRSGFGLAVGRSATPAEPDNGPGRGAGFVLIGMFMWWILRAVIDEADDRDLREQTAQPRKSC
jgi:hypothetical protein